MQLDQLRALAAVVDSGTFEAAATRLQVTPSAVSQRIRALEASVGGVVVRRQTPCGATMRGEPILRLARQVMALEAEARREIEPAGGPGGRVVLPIAVNADSLATWFLPVLEGAAAWPEASLHLEVEDEVHTTALLRTGSVMAAVTANARPVAGCVAERLGGMRYLPVAHPELAAAHRTARGGPDWSRLPTLRFNAKDTMQTDVLTALAPGVEPPTTQVPESQAFAAAVRAGVGWGMLPEVQIGTALTDGTLVRLHRRIHLDVDLPGQRWRIETPALERLTDAVRVAARTLRRPATGLTRPRGGPTRG